MRKLKYHEQKLLQKVNFTEWKKNNSTREHIISAKYNLLDREEYHKYNLFIGKIKKLSMGIAKLKENDPLKSEMGKDLVQRMSAAGFIKEKKLYCLFKMTVSDICNRRLPVIMKHNGMVNNIKDATTFVQHGHVKLGNMLINDPSAIIVKEMEQYITWGDNSKIKRKIEDFNEQQDDFKHI